MTEIAKTDDLPARINAAIRACGAHPARVVVLVPFAQLMKSLRADWVSSRRAGFMPRIETTINAARALVMQSAFVDAIVYSPTDLTFDAARDLLIAQSLLDESGLSAWRGALATSVMEAAVQLAPVAASRHPADRQAWAAEMRAAVTAEMDLGVLKAEAAVANLALIWAGMSSYETDVLFDPAAWIDVDCVVLLKGFQDDPVTEAVTSICRQVVTIDLTEESSASLPGSGIAGRVSLYAADDSEDEAECAAAVLIGHVERNSANASSLPIALVANDRELTRRVSARLAAKNVEIEDETGWKLSTTRAAAHVMTMLRGLVFDATSDAVIDWIKQLPQASKPLTSTHALALEAWLRRQGAGRWQAVNIDAAREPLAAELAGVINDWRERMRQSRSLQDWLDATALVLRESGQWDFLNADRAGEMVLAALHLGEIERESMDDLIRLLGGKKQKITLGEFTSWVNSVLEAASFRPSVEGVASVVVLPLSQLLARSFSAVVVPGCDEVRLPSSPEPAGAWTSAQRQILGLPSRDRLQMQIRAAWDCALAASAFAPVDILWRRSDSSGEAILPSPLLQLLQLEHSLAPSPDPRDTSGITLAPTLRPTPHADALPLDRLSASSYEDLRRCPYRFFALRNLGLQDAEELDAELDKRDFGNWLHEVLNRFHLRDKNTVDRAALIDECARETTESMRLPEGEFLPFAATWPAVRDGYLEWLASHESEGIAFGEAEVRMRQALDFEGGRIALVGQLDRIDRVNGQERAFVMDYKTENHKVTKDRVKTPLEDTQLAFYAALIDAETPSDSGRILRAAYVNVGDREGTNTVEQMQVHVSRDALLSGIKHDLERMSHGAPLLALGEGAVCEYCSARGLCRKDFWQ